MSLKLISPEFQSGDAIPVRYTCQGEDISPPLKWSGVPAETKSLALIFDDPDATGGPLAHWVIYNIPPPPNNRGLPENVGAAEELGGGGVQGRNDFGDIEYRGPCPPEDSEHRYYFRLYALDIELNLPPGANRQQVLDNIRDHILEHTELMVRFTGSANKVLL